MGMKNFNNYILLLEKSRIDQLKDKYSEKIPTEVIEYFEKSDPTQNKAYFEWLLKTYSILDPVEKERLEELKTPIHETFIRFINKYNKLKPKLSGDEADINNYRRILQLYRVIENNLYKDYSNSAIEKEGEVDILVNNYEWLIFTPYDFNVSEIYGHNDVKEGKNWCICYDDDYFKQYFGPDGGVTLIINKLDETKDLALRKEKDGNIEVWNYQDEHVYSYYVNRPNDFIDYLKKHTEGTQFIIDYFKEKPISKSDLPDIDLDTLRDRWVDANEDYVENYLYDYDYTQFIEWDSLEERVYDDLLDTDSMDNGIDAMINYIEENLSADSYNEEDVKNNMTSTELINLLRMHAIWEDFLTEWFDTNISGNENELETYFDRMPKYEQINFIDSRAFMEMVSKDIDDEDLYRYY